MATMLVKNGCLLDPASPLATRDILIEDGRIVEVRPGLPPQADRVIDASGRIVLPGLINAHAHSSTVLFRGLTDNLALEPWLFYHMHAGMGSLSPRELYVAAAIGAIELLRTGTTCLVEHAHLSGSVEQYCERATAIVDGILDAGMRVVFAPMYSDLAFSRRVPLRLLEEVPPDFLAALDRPRSGGADGIVQCLRELCRRFRGYDSRLSLCLGPANPNSCSRQLLEQSVALAGELGVGIHSHLFETKCMRVHTPSMVDYLREMNCLGPHVSFAHGVWLEESEIDVLADSGSSIVHNPISNLRLGSGLAPIQAMRARGLNVALGADNAGGANDSQNMFEVMKYEALVNKMSGDSQDWIGATEAFEMCLQNGARVVRQGIGSLAAGNHADMVIMGTGRLFGTTWDSVVNQLVYTDLGSSVETVIVGGTVVVENATVLTLNERELYAEARESYLRLESEAPELRLRLAPALARLNQMVAAARGHSLPFRRLLD